ncbi:MAG: HDIG domain-containing protein [Bacteroidales bacterium]|nr:HDIG domain-containing protein [Candidatus Physcousia equi]
MNRYNQSRVTSGKERLLHVLYCVAAIALLTLFCPRDTTEKLHYRIGEPWDAEALIARDSFDVYKNDAVLRKERDSLSKFYEPYYELQVNVAEEQLAAFKQELDSVAPYFALSHETRLSIIRQMQIAYDNGILPDSSKQCLASQNVKNVHVYLNNESQTVSTLALLSERAVYEDLMDQPGEARSALQHIKLNRYIQPNLIYDSPKSINQRREIDALLTKFHGRVLVGEKIVDKGQIVTPIIYDKLTSYEQHQLERSKTTGELWSRFGGQALYITLVVVSMFIFFRQFRKDYTHSFRHATLIWLLCVFFCVLTYIIIARQWASPYIVPYCMLPIFLRIFMDSRTAFISHLSVILLCAIAVNEPFEFICTETLAGLTAIYALRDLQQRSELFFAAVLVILTGSLTHLCLDLTMMNFFNTKGVMVDDYIAIACGGGLLLLSYLLLFPIEKIFKFTSTVTLVELSNINNPILRQLSEDAPGTFQHSMQVANLAAGVANKLGANAQLVRTAALYHDIGKLKNPVFFTENQSGSNPHNNLAFEDSAQVIIQHVKNGLEMASKYDLPQSIKNFIASHHGRSKTKFFYISYLNQNPGKKVNEEIFTYPGPNPGTLEEAILMMADAVEAASRSLGEYTEESISSLVDKIIDSQMQEGYFNRCPITFQNIDDCKQGFKEKLRSIYHTRISYPELKKDTPKTPPVAPA